MTDLFWWLVLAGGSTITALLLVTWALLRANALDTERHEQSRPYVGGPRYGTPNVSPVMVALVRLDESGETLIAVPAPGQYALEFARGKDGKIYPSPELTVEAVRQVLK